MRSREGIVLEWIFIIASYLLGSISFSYIVTKKIAGHDIREVGSKNAGATNTLRVIGVGPAILVLLLDALKGIIPVALVLFIVQDPFFIVLTGLAAILGHNWPIFFSFKGGKGVATTIGVVATFAFLPSLAAGIIAIISISMFRYVSLGSLIFVTLLPLSIYLFNYSYEYVLACIAIMILSYFRHRVNIVRLIQGEENKLGG